MYSCQPKTLGPRKVTLPQESKYRTSGVILPTCQTQTIQYDDLKHINRLILSKQITPVMVIQAQKDDPFLSLITKIFELFPEEFLAEKASIFNQVWAKTKEIFNKITSNKVDMSSFSWNYWRFTN